MHRMVSVTTNTFKTWSRNAFEYFPLYQIRINLNVYVAITNSTWYINEYYSVGTLLLLTLLSVLVSYSSSKLSLSKSLSFSLGYFTFISLVTKLWHPTIVYDVQSQIIIVVITLNIIAVTEHRPLIKSVLPLKLTFTMQLFENYPKHVQPLRQETKKLLLLSGATDEQQSQHTNGFYYFWQLTAAGKVFGT